MINKISEKKSNKLNRRLHYARQCTQIAYSHFLVLIGDSFEQNKVSGRKKDNNRINTTKAVDLLLEP